MTIILRNLMNPLGWQNEHKMALVLAIVIGCIFGIIVGYFVFTADGGAQGSPPFGTWLAYSIHYGVYWWAIAGGLVGGGIAYVKRLISN